MIYAETAAEVEKRRTFFPFLSMKVRNLTAIIHERHVLVADVFLVAFVVS